MALAKGAEGGAEWKDATDSTGSPPPAPSRTSLGTPRTRLVTGATRNPLHDLFGGVSAHDQERAILLVRCLAPPQLAGCYHHRAHGSSWIASNARHVASENSPPVSENWTMASA